MIKAGIIGDHDKSYINHINTNNALRHASNFLSLPIEISWLDTNKIKIEELGLYDLLWCAPGSPYKNRENVFEAIRFARENNVPFIGTCGGFQHAVIEFARNVLKVKDAEHAEYDANAKTLFVTPLVCSVKGQELEVILAENSLAYKCYNKKQISEQYHCNYGLNANYKYTLEQNGLKASGIDNNNEVRIIELPTNDFFIATLFLPQSQSTEAKPHPLIIDILKAADIFQKKNEQNKHLK